MGAPIPPIRLVGSHTCDRCGSAQGPHFRGYWGTLCVDCEIHRCLRGDTWRRLVIIAGLAALSAAIALAVWFPFLT
jgi:hypothetical protein